MNNLEFLDQLVNNQIHSILNEAIDLRLQELDETTELIPDIPEPPTEKANYVSLLAMKAALLTSRKNELKEFKGIIKLIYKHGYSQALLDVEAKKQPDTQAEVSEE